MKTTYIYGVRDLEIGKFIYAGKSNKPFERYKSHMNGSGNDCVRKLVKEKGQDNFQVELLEKVYFEGNRDWGRREKFWRAKFKREGHPLCNKTNGGGSGGGWHLTEETKARQSKAKLGKNNPMFGRTGKDAPSYGKPVSDETRAKLSKASTGKSPTLETREKLRKACSNVSEETRAKQSKAKMGKNNPNYGKVYSAEDLAERSKRAMGNEHSALFYPAFYNIRTKRYIHAGKNLKKLCREQNLNYDVMLNLKCGEYKQSKDGWCLV